MALLADAAHMLTDVVGLLLAYIAIRIGERKATSSKTFGYYRTEILAAVINAVVLLAISIYVLYEAYQRFLNPPEVQSKAMLIVAGIGLLVNIAGMMILRKSSGDSLNMKGAYFEVLSDMLTSVGVMIAGVVMLTTGWYYADPLISAGIGLLIFPRTWRLLMEAIHVLLEGTPKDVDIDELRSTMEKVPGVKSLHDLHVWSLTSGINAMAPMLSLIKAFRITKCFGYSPIRRPVISKLAIRPSRSKMKAMSKAKCMIKIKNLNHTKNLSGVLKGFVL